MDPTSYPTSPDATAELLSTVDLVGSLHRLSVDEYHRLGEQGIIGRRTELLRGLVIDKMSKTPLHAWITQLLVDLLRQAVGDGWIVRSELPLTLGDSEPEPDLSVVEAPRSRYFQEHPTTAGLVIEIATTSERLDSKKAALYAEAEIPEFWLILPKKSCVEVSREPVGGSYRSQTVYALGEKVQSTVFPGVSVAVASLLSPDE